MSTDVINVISSAPNLLTSFQREQANSTLDYLAMYNELTYFVAY